METATIVEVMDYSATPAKAYQWVTYQGHTEIFEDRAAAIAKAVELSPASATFRTQ